MCIMNGTITSTGTTCKDLIKFYLLIVFHEHLQFWKVYNYFFSISQRSLKLLEESKPCRRNSPVTQQKMPYTNQSFSTIKLGSDLVSYILIKHMLICIFLEREYICAPTKLSPKKNSMYFFQYVHICIYSRARAYIQICTY